MTVEERIRELRINWPPRLTLREVDEWQAALDVVEAAAAKHAQHAEGCAVCAALARFAGEPEA